METNILGEAVSSLDNSGFIWSAQELVMYTPCCTMGVRISGLGRLKWQASGKTALRCSAAYRDIRMALANTVEK